MGRKASIYLGIAIHAIALLMLVQYNRPKEVNWFPSYVKQHKIPYGTFILNQIMAQFFQDGVKQVNRPPFEFLTTNSDIKGTYFFVNDKIQFGDSELDILLDWAATGNTIFIASDNFDDMLLDTLHLEIGSLYSGLDYDGTPLHRLVHPQLNLNSGYPFKKDGYAQYFTSLDTLNTTILGSVEALSGNDTVQKRHFNIVKQRFGKGEILLSLFPKAFTNYFVLREGNKDYTAGLLSYLDDTKTIYMDNHYKSGKAVFTSPLYIFLSRKELKWAFYMVLIGTVFYIIFEGKRKQRAIPLLHPLKNQTLAFTRTIADMYFEKGEQKQMAEHKITYFLEYLRSHFYMDTQSRDNRFYIDLAARSYHSVDEIKELFNYVDRIKVRKEITDEELKNLNTVIEKFKAKANGRKH